MNKYLSAFFAIFFTTCSLALVSCSSDDEPEGEDTTIKFAAIESVIAVTPDLAEMCDIKATYYDTSGEKKTVSMNKTKVKRSFKLGTLSQRFDEWCVITFAEQLNYLPSTAEITLEFKLNGNKPSVEKPDLVVVRDIYGACFNDKGNKVKEGMITFSEDGAIGVSEEGWESTVRRFNSHFQSLTIAVSKDGTFNYLD